MHNYQNILMSTTLTKQAQSALREENVGARTFLTRDEKIQTTCEPGLYFVDNTGIYPVFIK